MLPIRIEATGPSALFPRVDADLEIAGAGSGQTQISLQGSYQPPLGRRALGPDAASPSGRGRHAKSGRSDRSLFGSSRGRGGAELGSDAPEYPLEGVKTGAP